MNEAHAGRLREQSVPSARRNAKYIDHALSLRLSIEIAHSWRGSIENINAKIAILLRKYTAIQH